MKTGLKNQITILFIQAMSGSAKKCYTINVSIYNDLSPRQAKALLKSPTPLADVLKKWDGWEDNHHMENIWNAVEARTNEVVRADFIAQKDAR